MPPSALVDPGTPSGLDSLLQQHGLHAQKRLGQNFLVDGNILDKIVDAAELRPGEAVLEIGPGAGALTLRLAERARRVVAVEIDRGLCRLLGDVLAAHDNVELIEADALKLDIERLFCAESLPPKAVCNLPYYITTPLLFKLLQARPRFASIIALMQREVADRLTASPGTKAYGTLSVALAHEALRVEQVGRVGPSVFRPRPEVESAVVRIYLRPDVDRDESEALARVVRAAFGHRRKTLRRALLSANIWEKEQLAAAFEQSGIQPERRGESLTLDEFLDLTHALKQ